MIVIDTNALLRYFLGEEPFASKVEKLLKTEEQILVPDIVFAEIEYVLTKVYLQDKASIERVYLEILLTPAFVVSDYMNEAFNIFKQTNHGIYDCILAAISLENDSKLASFDKKLMKIEGVRGYWR